MTPLPEPKLEIITDANIADGYQFIIIGKSLNGRYVNAGFSHTRWNVELDSYLYIAKEWLKLVDDTLESVVITASDNINHPDYLNALNKGIGTADVIRRSKNPLSVSASTSDKAWKIHGDGGRDIETIEQLTDHSHLRYRSNYDHLITVFTDKGQDITFACKSFSRWNLNSLYDKSTAQYCKQYNDQISTIILTRKDNGACNMHHLAVIAELLQTRQRFDSTHIQRMIGKPPQPPSTPPTIAPTAPKNPNNPPMNDAIHAQAGNTYLSLLAIISITILLCLPFQCAMAYTEHPKRNVSDLPSRQNQAFFVPNICLAPQAKQSEGMTNNHLLAYCKHRGNTVYDGVLYKIKEPFGEYVGRLLTLSWEFPVTFCKWHKPKTTLGVSRND